MATVSKTDDAKPVKLALNLIKADKKALQPRVEMDDDHMQRMARAYIEGEDIPPPVHVFYDGKFNWLVDGFHRYFAMWSIRHMGAKFTHIRAIVHQGTKQEAIAYAATANLDNRSKTMTDMDRKKAMWMLLDLDQYRKKSPTALSKLVGCSWGTGRRYWLDYFASKNIPVPKFAEGSDGRVVPTSFGKGKEATISKRPPATGGRIRNTAFVGGKKVELGFDEVRAKERLIEEVDKLEVLRNKYESTNKITARLVARNIHSVPIFTVEDAPKYPGFYGKKIAGIAVTWESFRDRSSGPDCIGRAIGCKIKADASRAVVLCPVEFGPAEVIELGRKAGIEFMTIEDFVASLQAEGESTPEE